MSRASGIVSFICFLLVTNIYSQEISYNEYTYAEKNGIRLNAYVFATDEVKAKEENPVIVIFHGGGWTMGEPSWAFGRAKHFAKIGFVAIAAHYRLSDKKNITPLDAMDDARDIIKWIRKNKKTLKIDPHKLVGYGWSAGAHLVTSAAIFGEPDLRVNSIPDALILVSPAVSLEEDAWFNTLLKDKIEARTVSPDENVRKGLPPTLILQGRDDTVTPLSGAQKFTNRMKKDGNDCELIIYDKVGHLFTPAGEPDNGYPNPDPEIQQAAYEKADKFLRKLGYIK
ncbi:MAG: alpha/beta hydrolase [Calditrichaceae bacterium]